MENEPYAAWTDLYDTMIDWPERLRSEGPVMIRYLRDAGAKKVVDIACGTGRHAWMLASKGYSVMASDACAEMLARAESAESHPVRESATPRFFSWDLTQETPSEVRSEAPLDAVLCFGNSFAHIPRPDAERTLEKLGGLLRPDGILPFQMKNLHRRVLDRDLFLPFLRRTTPGGGTALFVRGYEIHPEHPDGVIFHLFISASSAPERHAPQLPFDSGVRVHHSASFMQVWSPDALGQSCRDAGFERITFQPVSSTASPFDPRTTEDFYLSARKA